MDSAISSVVSKQVFGTSFHLTDEYCYQSVIIMNYYQWRVSVDEENTMELIK